MLPKCLPVEILDCIFSYLDLHSLQACSKACPIFSRVAERYLYVDITLHGYELEHRDWSHWTLPLNVTQLSSLLSEQPHIANYILTLTIYAAGQNERLYQFVDAIPPILDLLQKLRKLTVQRPWRCLYVLSVDGNWWLELDGIFGLSLLKSLRLPSMEEACFAGMIRVDRSLLNGIKSVKLDACSISVIRDSEDPSSDDSYPSLKDLSIIDMQTSSLVKLASCYWPAKCCKHLQHFQFSSCFRIFGDPFAAIEPILIACSNTLTTLDVNLKSFCKLNPIFSIRSNLSLDTAEPQVGREIPKLPILPHLKDASFHAKISPYRIRNRTLFVALTELLEIMPNSQRLFFHFHFVSISDDNLEADWSFLDDFLANHGRSAKVIDLCISPGEQATFSWVDQDPHSMRYPNINRMVQQNTLVIVSPLLFSGCYCIRS